MLLLCLFKSLTSIIRTVIIIKSTEIPHGVFEIVKPTYMRITVENTVKLALTTDVHCSCGSSLGFLLAVADLLKLL